MRKLLTFFLMAMLTLGLSAEPKDIQVVGTKTYAGKDMVKPIYIDVTVKNTSAKVDEGTWLKVRLVPHKPTSYRPPADGGTDAFSPFDMEQEIGSLQPGESRTIKFKTPYLAKNQFNTTARFFRTDLAPDLPINGNQQVDIQISVKE